jgi:ABC-type nitrate/sulfonate/bicarbonate transport system substrate-binding protein
VPLRLLVLALAAATAALAGCGGKHRRISVPARPVIDVGYAFGNDTSDVADRIAFARVRREGIGVRVRELGGVANAVVALVRGDVELATMPYSTAIRAVDEGAHVRVVLGRTMAPDFVLAARPGIDSVEALRGRRVAVDGPGLDGQTLVRVVLERDGVPASDVKLSLLEQPESRAAALATDHVDAAVLDQPDYDRLRSRGLPLRLLASLRDFRPRSTQSVWVVSQRYEEMHRRLVGRVVRGLLDGYAFVYTPAGRRAWTALARRSVLHGDGELAARTYAYYKSVRFWPLRDDPVTPAQHRRTVRFWMDAHQLDEYVPFSHVWDESFWRHAVARR